MEDFEILNQLHNIGISDGKIATQCNVSRQFICNVRNGKKKASSELYAVLREIYNAANQRGLFTVYNPPVQTRIIESTPVMAPVPYNPPTQYINPISIPVQMQPAMPVQPQPVRRQGPLSYAELQARYHQKNPLFPQPSQPKKPYNPKVKPAIVRALERREWKEECRRAKRNGNPMPPRPSQFEETPITETPKSDYQAIIEYQDHSSYRQW